MMTDYRQRTTGVQQITIGWNDQHILCEKAFRHEVFEQMEFGCQKTCKQTDKDE